jgi:hypothetical protein
LRHKVLDGRWAAGETSGDQMPTALAKGRRAGSAPALHDWAPTT